jgi:hypothetical protein
MFKTNNFHQSVIGALATYGSIVLASTISAAAILAMAA